MIILWIYLAGLVFVPIIFTLVNTHCRWLTKEDMKNDRYGDYGSALFGGWVLWPVTALVCLVLGVIALYNKLCIPE